MKITREVIKIKVSKKDAEMYNICDKCFCYFDDYRRGYLVFTNEKEFRANLEGFSYVTIKFLGEEDDYTFQEYYKEHGAFYNQKLSREELEIRINDMIMKRLSELEDEFSKHDYEKIIEEYIKLKEDKDFFEDSCEFTLEEYERFKSYIERFYLYPDHD